MLELIKDRLENEGISFEYLTGQTKDREARVNNFQTDATIKVFLISLKAGGVGLNLTEADYVYLVDPWWNPSVENQAIDRCYRIGQKKNVVAVRLITPNTIEDKIIQLQDSKKELVNDIVKTDESILKSIDKENLLALFE
jgi:SNF2 family DNA or RNA helicase